MKKQITACALALVMTSGVALAQDGPGAGRGGYGGPDSGWFAAMDVDGDGVITKEEVSQYQAERFKRMDTDGDGALSVDELHAGLQRERAERMHKWMDRDGDGRLSPEEFAAVQSKKFARMDADGDGKISQDESRPRSHMRGGKARPQASE